ncbi:hypothetical protein LCGC14_1853510 [marine sediment metagenome]|uniref:Uncharacterized protein n=1 Tax=marine sediment metagenome TaxID=412755 RepID=A0A0F9J8U1_9ZZZZ
MAKNLKVKYDGFVIKFVSGEFEAETLSEVINKIAKDNPGIMLLNQEITFPNGNTTIKNYKDIRIPFLPESFPYYIASKEEY